MENLSYDLDIEYSIESHNVWTVKGGVPYYLESDNNTWHKTSGTNEDAVMVSTGGSDITWYVNSEGLCFKRVDDQWVSVENDIPVISISVGSIDCIYGINNTNEVVKWDSDSNNFNILGNPSGIENVKSISVGCDNSVWCLSDTGKAYIYNTASPRWHEATDHNDDNIEQICVVNEFNIWGLSAGHLYQYSKEKKWNPQPMNDNITNIIQISAGEDGCVFGIDGNKKYIWMLTMDEIFKWVKLTSVTKWDCVSASGFITNRIPIRDHEDRSSSSKTDRGARVWIKEYWWGFKLYMNEKLTQDIIEGWILASSLGALISAALVFCGIMGGPAGALLASVIASCVIAKTMSMKIADKGDGVHWDMSWFQWAGVIATLASGPQVTAAALWGLFWPRGN